MPDLLFNLFYHWFHEIVAVGLKSSEALRTKIDYCWLFSKVKQYNNTQYLVAGIKAKKVLDTKKQICAGYKIKEPKTLFFRFWDNKDVTKIKFRKTSPVEYEAKSDV